MTDKAKALPMIDFTKSPQEIANNLENEFHQYVEFENTWGGWTKDPNKIKCAIKAVEIALMVCPMTNGSLDTWKRNPNHYKLTEVLQILKSKI